MPPILAIALGGALGAMLRFWVSTGVHGLLGRGFPYGTLTVNAVGSLLIGLLTVLLLERFNLGATWRAGILVGGLGAFTTFSTFSLETLTLLQAGRFLAALVNVAGSVVLCLSATWLGLTLGRAL